MGKPTTLILLLMICAGLFFSGIIGDPHVNTFEKSGKLLSTAQGTVDNSSLQTQGSSKRDVIQIAMIPIATDIPTPTPTGVFPVFPTNAYLPTPTPSALEVICVTKLNVTDCNNATCSWYFCNNSCHDGNTPINLICPPEESTPTPPSTAGNPPPTPTPQSILTVPPTPTSASTGYIPGGGPTTPVLNPSGIPYCALSAEKNSCVCQPVGEVDGVCCSDDAIINYTTTPDLICYDGFGGGVIFSRKTPKPRSQYRTCKSWCIHKPVVYLYPQHTMLVDVRVQSAGQVVISDPLYPSGGWKNVEAHPDGSLIYNKKSYHELFYETSQQTVNPPGNGILIPMSQLQQQLSIYTSHLGLIGNEKKEFLDFWIPKLSEYKTKYILFSILEKEEKERIDTLVISPKPDTMIEFIAYFKPTNELLKIAPLKLPPTQRRKGFTAVEWGGTVDTQ